MPGPGTGSSRAWLVPPAADRLGLGGDARALARLVDGDEQLARLVSGLVRTSLDKIHDDVLAAARR